MLFGLGDTLLITRVGVFCCAIIRFGFSRFGLGVVFITASGLIFIFICSGTATGVFIFVYSDICWFGIFGNVKRIFCNGLCLRYRWLLCC